MHPYHVLYAFHGVCRVKSAAGGSSTAGPSAAGSSTAGHSAAGPSNADDSVPVTTDQLINSSSAPPVQVHAGFRRRRRTPASKVVKRKKYEMADMVRLQMRQLQVERERLAVERQKVKCLEGIKEELTMVRVTLGNANGVEFMAAEKIAFVES